VGGEGAANVSFQGEPIMGDAAVPAKCKPITVSFDVLTEDELRKIIFGLTKGCNPDDTSFWNIHF
jgi:hypothetical protein